MTLSDEIKALVSTLEMQLNGFAKAAYEKDLRISELERQLAEASAPAVEQQPVGYACQYDLDCLANYNNATIFPVFDEDISPIALYAAPQAADTDKVREAIPDGWQLVPTTPTTEMFRVGCEVHDQRPSEVREVYSAMLAAAPLPAAPVQQEGDRD